MARALSAKTNLKLTKPHGLHEVDDALEVRTCPDHPTIKMFGEDVCGLCRENEQSQKSKPSLRAGGVAVDQLKSIINRVEKLEEEKAGIAGDIRDVFAEAKGNGFDVKAIRQILKIRRMDAKEREEQTAVLETYMQALGMLPLFEGLEEEGE